MIKERLSLELLMGMVSYVTSGEKMLPEDQENIMDFIELCQTHGISKKSLSEELKLMRKLISDPRDRYRIEIRKDTISIHDSWHPRYMPAANQITSYNKDVVKFEMGFRHETTRVEWIVDESQIKRFKEEAKILNRNNRIKYQK